MDGIVHYCVANMPGAVPRTSTFALTNATLPYCLAMTGKGFDRAMQEDRALLRGVNVHRGKLVSREVAQAQGREWSECVSERETVQP